MCFPQLIFRRRNYVKIRSKVQSKPKVQKVDKFWRLYNIRLLKYKYKIILTEFSVKYMKFQ